MKIAKIEARTSIIEVKKGGVLSISLASTAQKFYSVNTRERKVRTSDSLL